MNKTNLIPTSRLHARDRRQQIKQWVAIGIVYTLLLAGASFVACCTWVATPVDAAEIARVRNEISHQTTTQSLLRSQSRELQRDLQSMQEVARQPDWSILVAAVAKRCGKEIFLSDCEMSGNPIGDADSAGSSGPAASGNLILHLRGFGQSQEGISSFVLRLQEFPIFDRVKLLQTTRQQFAGSDAYAFQVDCAIPLGPESPHDQ